MKKALIILIIIAAAIFFGRDKIRQYFFKPTPTSLPTTNTPESVAEDIETIAEGLKIPWEVVFLPDRDLLVTERPGTLRRIGRDGGVYTIEGVEHRGEGGLLGLALHPDFEKNKFLYLYLTTRSGSGLVNRVERYSLDGSTLRDKKIIIDNIPGAANHDGGRIAFGPDKYLHVTTGDAEQRNLAQDKNSLAGKILRLTDSGGIPGDNPFSNAVYSYGHRNPQGLAWDGAGNLWATEHGPSGTETGNDEINLIKKGANYGWPVIRGTETRTGMESPVIESGKSETWAPAGAVFWNGNLFFAGLRGESLYEYHPGQTQNKTVAHLRGEFGRLRAVVLGPDNYLYITISNTDGRGSSRTGDDKIIRINPNILK